MFLVLITIASSANAVVKRVEKQQVEVHTRKIRTTARFEFSRSVRPGRLVKVQQGHDGVVTETVRVIYKDGKVAESHLIKSDVKEPVPTLYLMNRSGYSRSSRGSYFRSRVMVMNATAYDPSPATIGRGATGRTCTGLRATYGVIAVDPRVIPLGSTVFVEGYGLAIAADTGSAIKGNRIDLCYDSKRVADRYGMKPVRVHILQPR